MGNEKLYDHAFGSNYDKQPAGDTAKEYEAGSEMKNQGDAKQLRSADINPAPNTEGTRGRTAQMAAPGAGGRGAGIEPDDLVHHVADGYSLPLNDEAQPGESPEPEEASEASKETGAEARRAGRM